MSESILPQSCIWWRQDDRIMKILLFQETTELTIFNFEKNAYIITLFSLKLRVT